MTIPNCSISPTCRTAAVNSTAYAAVSSEGSPALNYFSSNRVDAWKRPPLTHAFAVRLSQFSMTVVRWGGCTCQTCWESIFGAIWWLGLILEKR